MASARYIDSLKNPRIPGFEWPEPEDSSDLGIFRDIMEKGAVLFSNDARNDIPAHSHSVGLYLNLLHPEILITGLSRSACLSGVGKICEQAASGIILKAGDERSDLFDLAHPIKFVAVSGDYYFDYLDYATWFYRSLFFKVEPLIQHKFPVLQAVWADKNGFYPDNPRCQETARCAQTLVALPASSG